jgi:hypothetical protein
MATQIGNKTALVVTDGLIMHWDAANKRSYTPGSSVIYDLAGSYNGTVTNGCSFSSNGSILVNGDTGIIYNTSINRSSGAFTVITGTRIVGPTRGRMLAGVSNNWLLGYWSGRSEQYYSEGWVIGAGSGGASDTAWTISTGTGDTSSDTWKFYSNSTLLASNNGGSAGPNGLVVGGYTINSIGALGTGLAERSDGEFSFLLVYNRVLSDAEIATNYNVYKRRYNLP